ncbi:MAG: AAA family ATPase [Bdellovibrionota bacterium]
MKKPDCVQLSEEQGHALELLRSGENVFLTGGAGSGKSFVVKELTKDLDPKIMPILASTGAAAVLLGGRTFHSFFGLGIMEGGTDATFERASKDNKILKRLKNVEGCIIDEISMIPGDALMIAEALAQKARNSKLPWGGMRMIAVGDFGQLPPVTKTGQKRDWCFLNPVWKATGFQVCVLKHNQRVQDSEFLDVLAEIRNGRMNQKVADFLNERTKPHDEDHPGTRLFPRREQSENYNQKRLAEISEKEMTFEAIYFGEEKFVTNLKKQSPVPETLRVKIGCRVMFLKNDMQKRWVNGTRGVVVGEEDQHLVVKKDFGREVKVEKMTFSLLDAEGNARASVIQFPLTLAYATTIHKSQGATLDELWCDLSALWEPGHAYVALSRLRDASGLHIVRWNPRSFIVDPLVQNFYQNL